MSASRNRILPLLCLAFASLACVLINPTPAAWSLTPTPSATPELLAVPPGARLTATAVMPATATAWQGLITTPTLPEKSATGTPSGAGTTGGLIVAQADRLTLLVNGPGAPQAAELTLPEPIFNLGDLRRGLSPGGEWLALRGAGADGAPLDLLLVHLPDGAVQVITSLSAGLAGATELTSAAALSALQAEAALSWSPGGERLAFIAAADGASADLYVYELAGQRVRRLTSGLNQAAAPVWSPDGRWIVHQEYRAAASGEAPRVAAVYAAAVDHNENRRLYTPPSASLGEYFLAWSGAETFITYSRTGAVSRTLREIPLNARWVYPAYRGPFAAAALDPTSHTVITIQSQASSAETGLAPGLYRFSAYDRPIEPELAEMGEWREVTWWKAPGLFVASGVSGALTLRVDGGQTLFRGARQAAPSPDGHWVITWGGADGIGLCQPDGKLLQQVSADTPEALDWLPDSSGFIYQAGTDLYRVDFPLARPQLIHPDTAGYGVMQ